MPRPSIIPSVRAKLEQYLEDLETQYQQRPEDDRAATLPATTDGKVNVRAIAQAIELLWAPA